MGLIDDAIEEVGGPPAGQPPADPAQPDAQGQQPATADLMTSRGNRGLANDVESNTLVAEPTPRGLAELGVNPGGAPLVSPSQVPGYEHSGGGRSAPAEPAAPANPLLDQAIQEVGDEQQHQQDADRSAAQFLAWKADNAGVDGPKAMEVLRYSQASGFPPEYVAQNLEVVKKQVDPAKVDLQAVAERSPALRDWMSTSSVHPAAAKEDIDALGMISDTVADLWHAREQFWPVLTDGVMQQVQIVRQAKDMFGHGTAENTQAVGEIQAGLTDAQGQTYEHGVEGAGRVITGGVRMLPMILLDQLARFTFGAVGGLAGRVLAGAGGGAGQKAGELGGSFVFNTIEIAAPLYWKLAHEPGENGEKMDPGLARDVALAGGMLGGAMMAAAGGPAGQKLLGLVSKFIPGADEIVGRYATEAVLDLFARGETGRALARAAARGGANYASGIILMTLQSGIVQGSEETAKALAGPGFTAHPQNVLEAMKDSIVPAARDTLLISVFHSGSEIHGLASAHDTAAKRAGAGPRSVLQDVLTDKGREWNSQLNAQRLAAMVEAAASSKSDPQVVGEVAGRSAKEPRAAASTFVDKEAWDRLAQDQKLDPRELAAQTLGDGGKAYDHAHATGGELVVPTDRFAQLAKEKPEIARALLDDSRTGLDDFTPRQIRARDERLQKHAKELIKAKPEEMDDSPRRVYEDLHARYIAAGVPEDVADHNAKLGAAVFDARAMEFTNDGKPTTAWDIHEANDFMVEGPRGQGLPPLSDAERPLEVAPDLKLDDLIAENIPTKGMMAAAEKDAQRMTSPERRAATLGFLKHVRDYLAGNTESRAPKLPRDIELELADEGIWDPQAGPPATEDQLRHVPRGGKRKTGAFRGSEGSLAALRRHNITSRMPARKASSLGWRQLAQPGLDGSSDAAGSDGAGELPKGHVPELQKRWAALTDEERVSRYFTDYNGTGLLNRRGYEAEARDPARPRTAEIQVEGFKQINDNKGHNLGDRLVNILAQGTRKGGITDAMREGNAVSFDVATPEDTARIAALAEEILNKGRPEDQRIRVSFGTSDPMPEASAEDRLAAASKAHREFKDAEHAAGRLAHRKGFAEAFVRDEKRIDYDVGDPVLGDTGEPVLDENGEPLTKQRKPEHLDYRGEKAKRIEERALKRAKDFAQAHEKAPPVDRAQLAPEHGQTYAQRLLEKGQQHGFDEVHLTPEGLLSLDGYYEAERAVVDEAKARYGKDWAKHVRYVAADARGAADTNRAFGARIKVRKLRGKPTDQIFSAVSKHLVDAGGAEFNVARPHGDEFYAVYLDHGAGEQEEKAREFFRIADEELKGELFARDLGDKVIVQQGVRIAHGHGPDFEHADKHELPEAKRLQNEHADLAERPRKPEVLDRERFDRLVRDRAGRAEAEPRYVGEAVGGPDKGSLPGGLQGDRGEARGEATPEGGEGDAAEVAPIQLTRLFQPAEGGDFTLESKRGRGEIVFTAPGGEGPRKFKIRLFKDADKSTLAHEMGHFFMEVISDLAARPDAPEPVKKDYEGIIKWAGYESHEQRLAEGKERRDLNAKAQEGKLTAPEKERLRALTAKEERVSHGFEQFLMEGKAPSVELAGVFARFRRWMIGIYKSIQGLQETFRQNFGEEIGLNDQVRGIFGRWMASDEEIEKAKAAQAMQPFQSIFADATPEERVEYERVTQKAIEDAKTEMVRRIAEANKRENNRFFTAERAAMREDVEREIDANPAQRALRYLQRGDVPETPGEVPELLRGPDGKARKLDRASLVRARGKEVAAALAEKHRGLFAAKGEGIPADQLAPLLGFDTGEALVGALAAAEPREALIKRKVEEQMQATHGPGLLDDHQALAEEALDSLHNEAAVQKALLERRRLAAKLNPARAGHALDLDPKVLRSTMDRLVRQKEVGELTAGRDGLAGYYLRAERTAAKRALAAAEAGKLEEALGHNEAQLLNMFGYRAARDLRDQLDLGLRTLKGSAREPWRSELGKADTSTGGDPVFRGVHDLLLRAVGLRGGDANDPEPTVLDALVGKAGEDVAFDVESARLLIYSPKPWDELSVYEAENLVDAVKNIRHLANRANELELAGRRMARTTFFEQLAQRAAKGKLLPAEANTSSGRTPLERLASGMRGLDAWLTEISSYAETLDGGDPGPMQNLINEERRTARDVRVKLDKRVVEQVRKHYDAMPKEMRNTMNERLPELAALLPVDDRYRGRVRAPETRSDLYALFLQSGNADNRQRIRDGNGWTDPQVNRALQLLQPAEARFLQGMLDTIQSLYPELAAVHEKRTGLPLGKVEPTPIRIGGETFPGGYFPLRYDPRIARQGMVQQSEVEAALFPQGYHSPSVYSGHTKERMQKVPAPVSLEFGTLPAHLAQVTQDIALGDWVRKVGSVVLDQRFQEISDKRLGSERTKLFLPWLRDIATERTGSSAAAAEGTPSFIQGMGAMFRNRVSTAIMSGNLPSMLAHLTDPLVAVADAQGPLGMAARLGSVTKAYLKVCDPSRWGEHPEFALSKELQFRTSREQDNIRKELAEIRRGPGSKLGKATEPVLKVFDAVNEVANHARFYLDEFHSRVLWLTGYDEGLAQGMTQEEAARYGDDLLMRTLPSGDVAERALVLRQKHGLSAVVMFYGYASKMYNLWVHRPLSRARDAFVGPSATNWSRASSVADLAAKWIAMGAIGALGAKLAGRAPDDQEDDKHNVPWSVRRTLLEPLNTMPVIGSVLEQAVEGKPISVRTAPEAQFIADTVGKLSRMFRKAHDGEGGDAEVWASLELLLTGAMGAVGGPAGQAQRTLGYLRAANEGRAPSEPLDVAKGVVYGSPHGR